MRPNGELAMGDEAAIDFEFLDGDFVGVLAVVPTARVRRTGVGEAVGVAGTADVDLDGEASAAPEVEEEMVLLGEKKFRRLVLRCSRAFSSSLSESSRTFRFLRGGMVTTRKKQG